MEGNLNQTDISKWAGTITIEQSKLIYYNGRYSWKWGMSLALKLEMSLKKWAWNVEINEMELMSPFLDQNEDTKEQQ